jgi:hypothetical protein
LAEQRAQPDTPQVRFEAADVPSWLPLWLALGLLGFVVLVLVGISLSYPLAVHQQYRGPLQPLPPAPRLQVTPGQDLQHYEAVKRHELEHSPATIEAAMKATVKQGWGPPQ